MGTGKKALTALLIGLVLAGGGAYAYYDGEHDLTTFRPVEATVVDAAVDRTVRGDPDGGTRESAAAEITYEYVVGGETYRSSNLRPGIGRMTGFASNAEAVVEQYPVGARVTAYYDPQNPADAFLLRQRSFFPFVAVGLGIFFALFGVRDVFSGGDPAPA